MRKKGQWGKIISILLTLTLMLTLPGITNIGSVYAANGNDVGIVSVSAGGGKITATLFNYSYTDDMQVSTISYYVDGKKSQQQFDGCNSWKKSKANGCGRCITRYFKEA